MAASGAPAGDAPGPERTAPVAARSDPVTLLHIGTMKSGTSYLQDTLHRNRDALEAVGVRYLGRGTRAVWDVLGLRPPSEKSEGAWDRLVHQAKNSASPVRLLSMEMLSTALDDEVGGLVAAFEPDPVEVVITARDIARVIPSAWQNSVKHGSKLTFPDFVDAVMRPTHDRGPSERFWKQHDVLAIATRWAAVVGADKVHLVTVPRSGDAPNLLWERFCTVVGVDPSAFDTQVDQSSNFSLSFSDAELVRQLNKRIGAELGRRNYERYIRTFLANEVMRPADPAGPTDTPTLDAAAHDWAVRHSERLVAELQTLGVNVVGDISELVPGPAGDNSAGSTPRITYPDTAVRAIAMLLRKLVQVDPEAAALEESPPRQRGSQRRQRKQRLAEQERS